MNVQFNHEKMSDRLMVLGCIALLVVGMVIVANPW